MPKKKQVVFRSNLFKNLTNEIRAKGVMIPEKDIERIVELYIRIILSSKADGLDNAKPFSVLFNPFDTIDFDSIDEDAIHSISNLVIEICGTLESLNAQNPHMYTEINRDTVGIITAGNNIATVFAEVQKMIHYIGAVAQDSLARREKVVGEAAYWEFESYDDDGNRFIITAVEMNNGTQVFDVSYKGIYWEK